MEAAAAQAVGGAVRGPDAAATAGAGGAFSSLYAAMSSSASCAPPPTSRPRGRDMPAAAATAALPPGAAPPPRPDRIHETEIATILRGVARASSPQGGASRVALSRSRRRPRAPAPPMAGPPAQPHHAGSTIDPACATATGHRRASVRPSSATIRTDDLRPSRSSMGPGERNRHGEHIVRRCWTKKRGWNSETISRVASVFGYFSAST
jgi:hypothetical protein